ncbi:hypothetical protein FHL81_06020 [Agrobacterium tumefaciens]|nr:hypothetical protein FHL81_06020 [Agrobacterium tumefaciens]
MQAMERVCFRRGSPRRKTSCLRNVEKQSRVCKQDQAHGRVASAALFRFWIETGQRGNPGVN